MLFVGNERESKTTTDKIPLTTPNSFYVHAETASQIVTKIITQIYHERARIY